MFAPATSRTVANAPRWLNPPGSIGEKYQPLGNFRCWEAKGRAREDFLRVYKDIKLILELNNDYLNRGERVPCHLMFSMYMIGRSEADALPTILFTSNNKRARRKAVKLIRKHIKQTDFPYIVLAESSHPPQGSQALQLLGSDPVYDLPPADAGQNTVYVSDPPSSLCGVPIFIGRPGTKSLSTARKATMGGVIPVGGECYGLTVAHAFTMGFEKLIESTEGKIDFAFDSDSDSDDGSFILDIGGYSPEPEVDRALVKFGDLATSEGERYLTRPDPDSQSFESYHGAPIKIGTVQRSSGNSLDWALVTMVDNRLKLRNEISVPGRAPIYADRIAAGTKPLDTEALAATGSRGAIKCCISGTPVFMKTPYNDKYQEVWVVRLLEGKISAGDCGSWVVNPDTGDIYGHIVAGHAESEIAYIIPACQWYDDIVRRFASDKAGGSSSMPIEDRVRKYQVGEGRDGPGTKGTMESGKNGLGKNVPEKPEPEKIECGKNGLGKNLPEKLELEKTDKVESGKNGLGKNLPEKPEPEKTDKVESGKNGLGKNLPEKPEPQKTESEENVPEKSEPEKTESRKNGVGKNVSEKTEPEKTESGENVSEKSEPEKTEPEKTELGKAEPKKAGQGKR
ncbi:MAG: peptide-N4-(N-acetyl-beta- glucosaminyl)asparagine amidase [Geoglossum simile]|nr:MAG: peptide-N4-(N-acetyl-beta- glucosaminyl)asparagine amidase [Geoglossum simile]